MAQPAFKAEQVWLRALLEHIPEVLIDTKAQRTMASFGIDLSEVIHVLRTGDIVYSEREERGAQIVVVGDNCDDEQLEIHGLIASETMEVVVNLVRKTNLRFQ